MLYEMEERLSHRMDAGFYKLQCELRGEAGGLKSQFSEMKSDFNGMKSEMSGIKSELHRVALLIEEQNARNRYVMDGYTQLYDLLSRRAGE